MSIAVSVENRIQRVDGSDETITAYLVDGRVISVPLAWSWDACRHYASGISRPYETLVGFRREATDLRAMCEPSFRGF